MEKVIEPEMPVRVPDKIEDAFSALKRAGIWPEDVVKPDPAYADDDATLYLRILLKEDESSLKRQKHWETTNNVVFIKHPLSLNRNVCVIFDEKNDMVKQALIDLGVVGEITITSSQDIKIEVLQRSDIIIRDSDVSVEASLEAKIGNKLEKPICTFKRKDSVDKYRPRLSQLICNTFIVPNVAAADGSFLVKVGHTGMTCDQIRDNILATMFYFGMLSDKCNSVKELGLKTRSSEVVPFFENSAACLDETSEHSVWRKQVADEHKDAKKNRAKAAKKQAMLEAQSTKKKEEGVEVKSSGKNQAKAGSPNLKPKLEDAVQPNGQASALPMKKSKKNRKRKAPDADVAETASPNLKRKLEDAVQANGQAKATPMKKQKVEDAVQPNGQASELPMKKKSNRKRGKKKGKAPGGDENNVASSNPIQTSVNGSAPNDQANGSQKLENIVASPNPIQTSVNQTDGSQKPKKIKKGKRKGGVQSPLSKDMSNILATATGNNVASPNPLQTLVNGSGRKDQVDGSPKPKKMKTEMNASSDDLVKMLMDRAKEAVFSPDKETAVIASAPGNQSKKNKNKSPKKKGGAKNLLPVQKDGELSAAFKEDLMSRLQEFTRGTDMEDIIVAPDQTAAPVKAAKKPVIKVEGQAGKTAEVKPVAAVSPGDKSPKKKKNKKNKSPNVVAPLANGNAQVKTEAPGNNMPKKNKNKKNKTPQKVNLVSPMINGNHMVKSEVTKVVALESPGTKLKKKKNKSPKKAKVAAL